MTAMEEREISRAVVERLPVYYRYLRDLIDEGVERISSQELSRIMHVTASQIRQDFNHFGGFGQQGYGYNTQYLYDEIGKILGLDKEHTMVLVGVGNLGSALVGYMNYRKRGFIFKAAFDIDPELIGQELSGIRIHPVSELKEYLMKNPVDIVVIAIPKQHAVRVAEEISSCPIKAVWNFAHTDLPMPEQIQVENVHLSDSLMKLSYSIRRNETRK